MADQEKQNAPALSEKQDTPALSVLGKKPRVSDMILLGLIYLCAIFAVALIAGIILYVAYRGISVVNWTFLTTAPSFLKGTVGIAGNIINTLLVVALTLLIATPIGVGSAIYLNEYAKEGRFTKIVEFTTETLSGIPSIIYGLFGFMLFGSIWGYCILTGSLTLAIMVLPLITRNTQEALKTVPASYRTGALGMGATKWYMIRTVLLPSAMPGIVTGIILAIGRIVGESAALLFTGGSDNSMLKSITDLPGKLLSSGGTLTIALYLYMSKAEYDTAFGIALVLIVIVLLINFATKALTARFDVTRRK